MMANRLITPSLADVSQDIAGVIPLEVILQWSNGDKTGSRHTHLLEQKKVKGTIVSSDAAGLSKLSGQKSLLEVMKLVHVPKTIICSYSSKIGGRCIGLWAADNTQTFYAENVPTEDVIQQMVGAQREISQTQVKIGMGIHTGEFIDIGGGFFGEDADIVELLAETYTEGGEIILTKNAKKTLSHSLQAKLSQKDSDSVKHSFFHLTYDSFPDSAVKISGSSYPYPFTKEFYDFLETWGPHGDLSVFQKYASEQIVILCKVSHQKRSFLLDQLTDWTLANMILKRIMAIDSITEIKSNGSLGIYITTDPEQAMTFAKDVRDTMVGSGYNVSIGIAKGETLVFPMEDGGKEIAGGPVNLASKLAEDANEVNTIFLEESVLSDQQKKSLSEKFLINISGVAIKGYKVV